MTYLSRLMMENMSLSKQLEPCVVLQVLGYYLIFIWFIATSLNGFILYMFIRYKQLRQTSTNIFISGLILADFIGACFGIPLPALALLNCRWTFAYVGCVLQSVITYFAGCSNMFMLCVISIDRYFVITKSFSPTRITIKQAYLITLCIYMFALFWTLMPIVGWSKYDYEGVGTSCSIKWEERSLNVISYNVTIFIFIYLIPVIIIIITNTKILQEIYHRPSLKNTNLNQNYNRRQILIEHRVTCTVILIISGFIMAWTPYALVVLIRFFIDSQKFPPLIATIPALIAKTSLLWNPLIYVIRNGNIRLFFPSSRHHLHQQRRETNDVTRYSIYPYSTVQLPLPS